MAAHRSAEKRVRDWCVEPEKKPELAAHRPEGADLAQGGTDPGAQIANYRTTVIR